MSLAIIVLSVGLILLWGGVCYNWGAIVQIRQMRAWVESLIAEGRLE